MKINTNLILEVSNGAWSILAFSAVIFLLYHLYDIGARRHITFRRWFVDLPQSMQLAVAVLTLSVGVLVSRAPIWWWRIHNNADVSQFDEVKFWLIAGALIGCAGFMCIIRVVTRPMQSNLPWIIPTTAVVLYGAMSFWFRAYT